MKKFINTGDLYNDFNINHYDNADIKQLKAKMGLNSYSDMRYYNDTDIKVEYTLMIYLAENGDYTSRIDLYELYHYNNLKDAIQASYTIKLLTEKEQSKGKYNIEGYRLESTVRQENNIVMEEATDVLESFKSAEEIGIKNSLGSAYKEIDSLKEELNLYKDYLKQFNINKDTIEKHNRKKEKEAV